jgi:hypothetical protein
VAFHREKWKDEVRAYIKRIPQEVRAAAEELWRAMEQGVHGEYACCGVHLRGFCESLTRADVELEKKNRGVIMKLLKIVGSGARGVLKTHTGINEVNKTTSLTQMSIKKFFHKERKGDATDDVKNREGIESTTKRSRKRYRYVNPGVGR